MCGRKYFFGFAYVKLTIVDRLFVFFIEDIGAHHSVLEVKKSIRFITRLCNSMIGKIQLIKKQADWSSACFLYVKLRF